MLARPWGRAGRMVEERCVRFHKTRIWLTIGGDSKGKRKVRLLKGLETGGGRSGPQDLLLPNESNITDSRYEIINCAKRKKEEPHLAFLCKERGECCWKPRRGRLELTRVRSIDIFGSMRGNDDRRVKKWNHCAGENDRRSGRKRHSV